ncbi:MAG TPA: hypothetical protein VFI73_03880, partial [Candidatus Nitrosopolaris sp.]|nr:hypothetical protein [Candidatus Nitrosopolaris sp.]
MSYCKAPTYRFTYVLFINTKSPFHTLLACWNQYPPSPFAYHKLFVAWKAIIPFMIEYYAKLKKLLVLGNYQMHL